MECLRILSSEEKIVHPTRSNSDFQIAFLNYGDFRDASAEDHGAHQFEGFLVVASKKAIRCLFLNRKAELSSSRARLLGITAQGSPG
jgi:hypothetical protein